MTEKSGLNETLSAQKVIGWVRRGKDGKIGNYLYTYEPHCDTAVRDDGGEKIAVVAITLGKEEQQEPLYYLQDARWGGVIGNCLTFWRKGGGYTTNLDKAARFTLEAAMNQHKCRETDLPWLCTEVDKLRRPTVDCQYMPRSWQAQADALNKLWGTK